MAADASGALGAPEIAGTLVNPKGYAKNVVARTAGREVAGLIGDLAAGRSALDKGIPDLPDFGRVGYLAVSADEVALVKTKYGWKMTPTDEALARAARSELASVEWDEGRLISHLRLVFSSGQIWEFDVPKSDKKTGKAVVATLGG
ncbi:MAG TPA: hypothetical protein VIJ33_07615 [Solirubrobacteraceae bacterium]